MINPGEGEEGVLRALDQAGGADLIVKASGVGVFDELLERSVLDLQRPGTLVAFWDVDAPAALDRVEQNPADAFRELRPSLDLRRRRAGREGFLGNRLPDREARASSSSALQRT
jgi:hypothetical protein